MFRFGFSLFELMFPYKKLVLLFLYFIFYFSIFLYILESVQKKFTKQIIGKESLIYNERLVALKLPSFSCRLNDLTLLHKSMHNLIDTDLSKLFHLHPSVSVSSIVTRGHSLKLHEPKPRM